MLDSGAEFTMISSTLATATGVTAERLAHDRTLPLYGATNEIGSTHVHRFDSLVIGRERFPGPPLIVGAISQFAAIVGFDYLSKHRVWISYASQRLFLGRPVPAAVAAISPAGPSRPAARRPPD